MAPSSQEVMLSPHSSSQPSTQSSSLSEQLFSWYDAAAASVNTGSQPPGGDYSSLDRKGVSRCASWQLAADCVCVCVCVCVSLSLPQTAEPDQ